MAGFCPITTAMRETNRPVSSCADTGLEGGERESSVSLTILRLALLSVLLFYGWLGLSWRSVRFGYEYFDSLLQSGVSITLGALSYFVFGQLIPNRVIRVTLLSAWLLLPEVYYGVQDYRFHQLVKRDPTHEIIQSRWPPNSSVDLVYYAEGREIHIVD
jgi:hypothetical protein